MKKAFVLSFMILCISVISLAENVYVVGWASDGISTEKSLWKNGTLHDLSWLGGGNLCGFDIDNGFYYFATYTKTATRYNDYYDIEISIYRDNEKLYNFKVEEIKSPYLTNLVVVNGNAYIVINYFHFKGRSDYYDYKIYKNGVFQNEHFSPGDHSYTCEMLEKSNGYVFIAKTKEYYYSYDNRKSYWGYEGPNRHALVELPSYNSELYRLRVFNNDVYLMGSIGNTAYICQNNEKPQKISGYKKCTDFAIVNYSRYWIVDNILINSQGSTILTDVYGMQVYGNNLYVWGMYNHSYCYWIIYPNGTIERVDLPSCVGINNLNITD
ncbi:MAG: hypothetical protein IJ756_09360 [Paludibacteraceae bacterium]|nr:hypothetical protein [Paludibacteraceae bacterium]